MQSNLYQKFLDRYVGIPLGIIFSLITFVKTLLAKGVKQRSRSSEYRNVPELSPNPPKKILFIQLSALGDTILAIPTIRAFRQSYPDTELSFLATPTNLSYLDGCPYIDHRIQFSNPSLKLIQMLRREQFDYVVDLEHWSRFSMLIAYATGASRLIGFSAAHQYRHYIFTDVVPHIPGKHEVLNFLSIADELGCNTEDTNLEVWIGDEESEWCRNMLAQEPVDLERPLVVLHPEAGRRSEPRRRWPLENYIALADALSVRYGAQIVLTGAPDELPVSQWIAKRTACKMICLTGKTDVNQLAALFTLSDLVISGNCGPMHLAAAAGTPVIAIHGPTNSVQWGPLGEKVTCIEATVPCSPCLNLGFEYGCQALPDGTSPCMHTIDVTEVLQACEGYLG